MKFQVLLFVFENVFTVFYDNYNILSVSFTKNWLHNLHFWQVSHSSQRWPSVNYWPQLAESYGIKFKNINLTYENTSRIYINSTEVGHPDKLLNIMNQIEDFINKNFLKVYFLVFFTLLEVVFQHPATPSRHSRMICTNLCLKVRQQM